MRSRKETPPVVERIKNRLKGPIFLLSVIDRRTIREDVDELLNLYLDAVSDDPRVGGVWGDRSRAGQKWTNQEDRMLIEAGPVVGFDFIAAHDLNRSPREGVERIEWLRANRPQLVAAIESKADEETLINEGE